MWFFLFIWKLPTSRYKIFSIINDKVSTYQFKLNIKGNSFCRKLFQIIYLRNGRAYFFESLSYRWNMLKTFDGILQILFNHLSPSCWINRFQFESIIEPSCEMFDKYVCVSSKHARVDESKLKLNWNPGENNWLSILNIPPIA